METERTACNKITLRDYVQYFSGADENIQIVLDDDDWNDYVELSMHSKMLALYMPCQIEELGLEVNIFETATVARVRISTGVQNKTVALLLDQIRYAIVDRINRIETDCPDPAEKAIRIVDRIIEAEKVNNSNMVIRWWPDE